MQAASDGRKRPVGFASRRLTDSEKNYPPFIIEMAAACYGMEYFDTLLRHKRFYLYTDHKPLVSITTRQTKTLNRLQLKMQDMHPVIRHIPGDDNTVADFLSRYAGLDKPNRNTDVPVTAIKPQRMAVMSHLGFGCAAAIDVSPTRVMDLQANDLDLAPLRRKVIEATNGEQDFAVKIQGFPRPLYLHKGALFAASQMDVKGKFSPSQLRQNMGKVLAPRALVPEIISEAHNSKFGGHNGAYKSTQFIKQHFWWPGMEQDIADHVKTCRTCQAAQHIGNPEGDSSNHLPIPSWPNQRIHADLFGPLKTSDKGNAYICVITDALTKYTSVQAIPDKSADTVTSAILRWIYLFGVPKVIITDQGTEFCNLLSTAIYKSLDVQHGTTTPYHPQCNGQVESFNKVMAAYLRKVMADAEASSLDWEVFLGPLMISYNSSTNSTTRIAPHKALLGYDSRLPLWSGLDQFNEDDLHVPHSQADALANLRRAQVTAQKVAHHNAQHRQNVAQQDFDNRLSAYDFEPGDRVWVRIPDGEKGPNPKLSLKWEEGEIVARKEGQLAVYKVKRIQRKRKKVITINVQRLKPFHQSVDPGTDVPTPDQPPDPIADDTSATDDSPDPNQLDQDGQEQDQPDPEQPDPFRRITRSMVRVAALSAAQTTDRLTRITTLAQSGLVPDLTNDDLILLMNNGYSISVGPFSVPTPPTTPTPANNAPSSISAEDALLHKVKNPKWYKRFSKNFTGLFKTKSFKINKKGKAKTTVRFQDLERPQTFPSNNTTIEPTDMDVDRSMLPPPRVTPTTTPDRPTPMDIDRSTLSPSRTPLPPTPTPSPARPSMSSESAYDTLMPRLRHAMDERYNIRQPADSFRPVNHHMSSTPKPSSYGRMPYRPESPILPGTWNDQGAWEDFDRFRPPPTPAQVPPAQQQDQQEHGQRQQPKPTRHALALTRLTNYLKSGPKDNTGKATNPPPDGSRPRRSCRK